MKIQKRIFAITFLALVTCFLFASSTPVYDVSAGGEMELGTTTYVIDQPMVVYFKSMTSQGGYGLAFTAGCHALINFTFGHQTTGSFSIKLAAPTSGDTCTITLNEYTVSIGGGLFGTSTTVTSLVLSATDYADIFPDAMIIGLAITIFVISILVSIAVGMRVKNRS